MGVKGTPNVRRRPIARGALGALMGRRMAACAPSVIPAQAGIQATCGVKGTPNVRRRPIARGAPGALMGRRMDGGTSRGWVVAWIPASAGMTEGGGRKGGNGGSTEDDGEGRRC